MNSIISSGNIFEISNSNQYVVKDDEVCINQKLYKKKDVEISMSGNHENAEPLDVKIGIHQRDSDLLMCANPLPFNKWKFNGLEIQSLTILVSTINTAIK